jgi:hypothetical protein
MYVHADMELLMSLTEYLNNGGTLETLHKSGASIIDRYQQPPFQEHKVGRISHLVLLDRLGGNNTPLYRVKYASGAVRESLAESWIQVRAKVKLDLPDIE